MARSKPSPRHLTMQRSIVPQSERKKYMERLKQKRDYFARADCRFWVFEEASLPGAFLEFIEAADAETLANAQAGAPEKMLDPNRIYREVEIS
jgi:hypothetical protein